MNRPALCSVLGRSSISPFGTRPCWVYFGTCMILPSPPKCRYCMKKTANARDHVVPRIHGGPDNDWNCVLVCQECSVMLSYYLPVLDGDTTRQIYWKKALFLRGCRNALARNSEWRRLGRNGRWEEVRG